MIGPWLQKDGKLSAQWEHTILVTDNGYEVLTLREEEAEEFSNWFWGFHF